MAWQPTIDSACTRADKIVLLALASCATRDHQHRRDRPHYGQIGPEDSGYDSDPKSKLDDASSAGEMAATDMVDEEAYRAALDILAGMTDRKSLHFEPTIFTTWDNADIPIIPQVWLNAYVRWAQTIVRKPTDVVFVSHFLIYSTTVLPSAAWLLFGSFSYLHGILHLLYAIWCAGSFTLMMYIKIA